MAELNLPCFDNFMSGCEQLFKAMVTMCKPICFQHPLYAAVTLLYQFYCYFCFVYSVRWTDIFPWTSPPRPRTIPPIFTQFPVVPRL